MAHHSQSNDPEMIKKFMENYHHMVNDLGATGQFPNGKLTKQDEGEIKFAVITMDNKVVIEFGQSAHWFGMTGNS